jgi:hypothetical protein
MPPSFIAHWSNRESPKLGKIFGSHEVIPLRPVGKRVGGLNLAIYFARRRALCHIRAATNRGRRAMAVQIFLSCVTGEFGAGEFGAYREPLRRALKLPEADVATQEDFKALGGDTLTKLEDYIRHCQLVLHVLGETAGAAPPDLAVQALLRRHSDLSAVLPPLGEAIAAGAEITYTHW